VVSPSIGAVAVGTVVLVAFPFSDLSQAKQRPAVVLANAERGDWVLCQVTSKAYADPTAITIENDDFGQGSLKITSYVRLGKLFTANASLMLSCAGTLNAECIGCIIDGVIERLKPSLKPKISAVGDETILQMLDKLSEDSREELIPFINELLQAQETNT